MKNIVIVALAIVSFAALAAPAKTVATSAPHQRTRQAGRGALEKKLNDVKKKLSAKPGDATLKRAYAELNAAVRGWPIADDRILVEFAELGGDIAKHADAESKAGRSFAGAGKWNAADVADFWWDYKPVVSETEDVFKEHAAKLYQEILCASELDGLRKVVAENRVDEMFWKRMERKQGRGVWRDGGTQKEKTEQLMKYTYIPYVDVKQPATIIDAVEFFRDASRRYDPRPKVPVKDKGISFILKLDDADAPAQTHAGFGAADVPEVMPSVPKLSEMKMDDISLYDAVKHVCESVGYKMLIHDDGIVVIKP